MQKSIKNFIVMLMVAILALATIPVSATTEPEWSSWSSSEYEYETDESEFGYQFELNALHENQVLVVFEDNIALARVNERAFASQRLERLGFTQGFIDNMSDATAEFIANADYALVSLKFFAEVIDGQESNMVEISRNEFIQMTPAFVPINPNDIKVINHEDFDVLPLGPFGNGEWTERQVDGGTLFTITSLFGVNSHRLSHYQVVSNRRFYYD